MVVVGAVLSVYLHSGSSHLHISALSGCVSAIRCNVVCLNFEKSRIIAA
jgi:hypothetical protein